jgi:hypothetical protein
VAAEREEEEKQKTEMEKFERTGGKMEIEFQKTNKTHTQVDDGWYCVDYYYL